MSTELKIITPNLKYYVYKTVNEETLVEKNEIIMEPILIFLKNFRNKKYVSVGLNPFYVYIENGYESLTPKPYGNVYFLNKVIDRYLYEKQPDQLLKIKFSGGSYNAKDFEKGIYKCSALLYNEENTIYIICFKLKRFKSEVISKNWPVFWDSFFSSCKEMYEIYNFEKNPIQKYHDFIEYNLYNDTQSLRNILWFNIFERLVSFNLKEAFLEIEDEYNVLRTFNKNRMSRTNWLIYLVTRKCDNRREIECMYATISNNGILIKTDLVGCNLFYKICINLVFKNRENFILDSNNDLYVVMHSKKKIYEPDFVY